MLTNTNRIDARSLSVPGSRSRADVAASPLPENPPEESFQRPVFATNLEGALWWFEFGYKVIPIVPGWKRPAVPHHPWLKQLSVEMIQRRWSTYPQHEVGAVLDMNQILIDADTDEAQAALLKLEERFSVTPSVIIKTLRGY